MKLISHSAQLVLPYGKGLLGEKVFVRNIHNVLSLVVVELHKSKMDAFKNLLFTFLAVSDPILEIP